MIASSIKQNLLIDSEENILAEIWNRVARHPELCAMDALHLGSALNAEVEQLSKIDRRSVQATQCMFAVRQPLKRRD